MKKFIWCAFTVILILQLFLLAVSADGIDSERTTLCEIEGHSYETQVSEWCEKKVCSVCGETEYVFGLVDVNSDGEMNVKDLINLKKQLANPDEDISGPAADVDCSGTVDVLNLTQLKKILLGSI